MNCAYFVREPESPPRPRVELKSEEQNRIGCNGYGRGLGEAMHGTAGSIDLAAVADDGWVNPVVVNVAIEEFPPCSAAREAERIVVEGLIVKADDDHHVEAITLEPAMECEDSVVIVHVRHADRTSAESRLIPAQTNQVLREAQEIDHGFVTKV